MSMDIEATVRKYLTDVIHLSLATSKDGRPWVCEVLFAYDKNLNLYFRSLPSRRHSQEIAENPNVAGNIVRPYLAGEFPLGIYFEGTAKVLLPGKGQDKAFRCLQDRLHLEDGILEDAQNPKKHQFYKITIDKWHLFVKSDRDRKSGTKHTLDWNGGVK